MKIFPMPGGAYLPSVANQQYHWYMEQMLDEHPKITHNMDLDHIKLCCYHIVNSKIFNDCIGDEVGYENSYRRKLHIVITDTFVGIYVGLSCYDTNTIQEILCYDHIAMKWDPSANDTHLYLMRFDTGEENNHHNPSILIKPITDLTHMLFGIPSTQLSLI